MFLAWLQWRWLANLLLAICMFGVLLRVLACWNSMSTWMSCKDWPSLHRAGDTWLVVGAALAISMSSGLARIVAGQFAIHPTRVTTGVMLFLPDRHALLYFINDVTAGIEGCAAMCGGSADPHGHIADF